jgi:holliday junction DNA helicase RuvA
MIGWLQGKIIEKSTPGKITLNVTGIGYEIETSLHTFFQLENRQDLIEIYIHTVVREDAFLLYGFAEQTERTLFRSLIKVSGVGPKVALGILSSIAAADFINCIKHKDLASLTRLPGIGKKTAERLVIEMRDKIDNFHATEHLTTAQFTSHDEAISALEALGFKRQEAVAAIKKVDDGASSCEELIRRALRASVMRTSS